MSSYARFLWASVRALLVLTLILGLGYPLVVWGIGQVAFKAKANGSYVQQAGTTFGSTLIGQSFTGEKWFWSRPSAAGTGYDAMSSGASNLGPTSKKLLAEVQQRKAAVAQANGVSPDAVPADALTASGSGLDPDISPAYADLQVARVARANGLTVAQVKAAVAANTHGRVLGFLGEEHVNVLQLNLAIAALTK